RRAMSFIAAPLRATESLQRSEHGYALAVLQFPANLAETCLIFRDQEPYRERVIQMPTGASLRFEDFTLDLEGLRLPGPSSRFHLRKKSFEVLRYLVEHPGRVVTREELTRAVWPDVVVGDESLTHCIGEIRRTIGDHAQRIIKTIPSRGYLMD